MFCQVVGPNDGRGQMKLERSSPTPTNEAFTAIMQYLASTHFDTISNAFGQALKTRREQKLCCRSPYETEVYGLISGPSWLRQALVADLESMG
eukprot:7722239-Karenia_brevis.AAC.1